jgi:nucleoside-diphosphate-sugar epimerase
MRAAYTGEPIRLTRPGLTHDWIHVDDVVDACLRAASTSGVDGEVLNVATGVTQTNEAVVRLVEEASGRAIRVDADRFPDRPWDTDAWVGDVSKTTTRLGWQARTVLGDGLARTHRWFGGHLDLYAPAGPGGP